jgi:hypothetical protein
MLRDLTATVLALLLGAAASSAGPASSAPDPGAAGPVPDDGRAPVVIEVEGRGYRYYPLSQDDPLTFNVSGPIVFTPILRWRFVGPPSGLDVEVQVVVDGVTRWNRVIRARGGNATYPGRADWVAGRSSRMAVGLPSGEHTVELRLVAPSEGVLDVNPVVVRPAVMPWRIDWRCGMGASYDSNIFRYSDTDVDDFLDGARPERFAMDHIDDVRLEPSVSLSFVREEPGRRETDLRLAGDWRLAAFNGEKSFAKLSVRLKERRPRVAYLSLGYFAVPDYHVRRLWDEDTGEYRSCDFRQHTATLELGSDRSLPVDVAFRARYDYYGYDQDFVEYDSSAGTFGAVGTVRPAGGLRVDLGYALKVLRARGYDEIGETRASSDDSDISYEQDEYSVRVRWEAGKVGGLETVLKFRGTVRKRYYQAAGSAEEDPYHAGREDTYWAVSLQGEFELIDDLDLEAFYEHRRRNADSGYVDDMWLSKDYAADRFGVRLVTGGGLFLD